jgi:REP element-mobilizing transposase RayT
MPNHVHVIVEPLPSHELSDILQSWKSFTAKGANRLLQREGVFWQKESYDHIVRDRDELERTIRYVRGNPANARLKDWPWVWPG